MLPSLPQDIFVHILDALDTQYTSGTGEHSGCMWQPGRVATLRNIALASHLLCTFARPRLFAHIDFDAGRDAQGRAARLLSYFPDEQDGNPRPDETRQRRLQSIRSFRFRDGRASCKRHIPQTRWEPDLATPLGRLLALFLNAPHLQMFAFEGSLWTLAGAGELVGYHRYIHAMSCKPSLRILAVTNAYDIPIDIFFRVQGHQQSPTDLQTVLISKVSFSCEDLGLEIKGAMALATPHHIERLKLGRLNYVHFFDLLQMRCNAIGSHPRVSSLTGVNAPFHQLKSLSLALSAAPAQMVALWNFVYGLRETLEDLQLRGYENIPDKSRSGSVSQADNNLVALGQTFSRLHTLMISTHILGSAEQWMNPVENLRWGLPLVLNLLETFVGCSTPKLRQLNLEVVFMGGDASQQQDTESTRNVSADKAAANPVWQKLDSLVTAIVHTNPTVTTGITMLPFFLVQRERLAEAEDPLRGDHLQRTNTGRAFGLDQCLPNLFAKTRVDVHINPVRSDRHMLTYLWSA